MSRVHIRAELRNLDSKADTSAWQFPSIIGGPSPSLSPHAADAGARAVTGGREITLWLPPI